MLINPKLLAGNTNQKDSFSTLGLLFSIACFTARQKNAPKKRAKKNAPKKRNKKRAKKARQKAARALDPNLICRGVLLYRGFQLG